MMADDTMSRGVRVVCARCSGIVETWGGLLPGQTRTMMPPQCIGGCTLEPRVRIPSDRAVQEAIALVAEPIAGPDERRHGWVGRKK